MTSSLPMSRKEKLRRVAFLCCSFGRNLAYYRAGWDKECKQLLELDKSRNARFWRQVNSNFVEVCVLEWCKLFADPGGKFYWVNIVSDRASFKVALLRHLGLSEDGFSKEIDDMRTLRDKHIAHSDAVRTGYVPVLDVAKRAVWFYYDHIVRCEAQQGDLAGLPQELESGYLECLTEAMEIYRREH
jgi:hypothetical protein